MDKVLLNNLAFYGYHGALKEEKEIGQKFFIDLELSAELKRAGESDRLEDAINYAAVYQLVKDIFNQSSYDLIEALAEAIAAGILDEFAQVKEVFIRVKKPEAPVAGIFDYFGVELNRSQKS